jgi:hypothetical protein
MFGMKRFYWMSTKFVQINAKGSKLALPQGVIDFLYTFMYTERTLKLLVTILKSYSLNIWHETSSSGLLPSLLK